MRGARLLAILVAIVVAAALVGIALTQIAPPQHLTEVYTPGFPHVPPAPPLKIELRHLWSDLKTPQGQAFLQRMLPNQGGVLWLSLVVALLVAFDWAQLDNPRNVDLIAMQAIGLVMFEILRFPRLLLDAVYVELMDWVFIAIFTLNVVIIVRAWLRIRRPTAARWRPAVARRALIAVAAALFVVNVMEALIRDADDVGFFANLGAQRLRERHALPYGDPLLTGSAGAAYGPLLYVAHLPFQWALAPARLNAESPDLVPLGRDGTYNLPPALATKLCTIAFHIVGVIALFIAARRLAGADAAWALVALYCGSAYVLGIGGDDYFIGGMTYISHIAPTAVTLLAFALLPSPAMAGVALALAAGVGFYPGFMAPAWLGYYWDRKGERAAFAVGFVIAAAAIGLSVLLLSRPAGGRGLVATILNDTFGHHTDPRHYGFSPFSFWGQKGGIRGWFNHSLVGTSGFTTPMFLTFTALVVGCFWLVRRRSASQLALATAIVALAASLTKIHPTGTYIAWAYPFLLLGFFAD
jgi:hypothetical protein